MGEYVYTLRAKTVKFEMNGQKVEANLFSYLTKPFGTGLFRGSIDPTTRLGTARAEKMWSTKPMPTYAVNMDADYINEPAMPEMVDQMFPVYTNLKSAVWYDCADFPGQHIGFIVVHSGKIHGFYTVEQNKKMYEERAARREAAGSPK